MQLLEAVLKESKIQNYISENEESAYKYLRSNFKVENIYEDVIVNINNFIGSELELIESYELIKNYAKDCIISILNEGTVEDLVSLTTDTIHTISTSYISVLKNRGINISDVIGLREELIDYATKDKEFIKIISTKTDKFGGVYDDVIKDRLANIFSKYSLSDKDYIKKEIHRSEDILNFRRLIQNRLQATSGYNLRNYGKYLYSLAGEEVASKLSKIRIGKIGATVSAISAIGAGVYWMFNGGKEPNTEILTPALQAADNLEKGNIKAIVATADSFFGSSIDKVGSAVSGIWDKVGDLMESWGIKDKWDMAVELSSKYPTTGRASAILILCALGLAYRHFKKKDKK